MNKRLISWTLAMAMAISLFSTNTIATGTQENTTQEGTTQTELGGQDYGIAPMSLIPIPVVNGNLDLTGMAKAQLNSYALSDIIANTVWDGETPTISDFEGKEISYELSTDKNISSKDDNYTTLSYTNSLSLDVYLEGDRYQDTYYLEMIVGTQNQLDAQNKRYLVEITYPLVQVIENIIIYTETDSREKVTSADINIWNDGSTYDGVFYKTEYGHIRIPSSYAETDGFYVALDTYEGYESIQVYEGFYESINELESAFEMDPTLAITEGILSQSMGNTGEGYFIDANQNGYFYDSYLTIVKDGYIVQYVTIDFYIVDSGYVSLQGLYAEKDSERDEINQYNSDWTDAVNYYNYSMLSSEVEGKDYYLGFKYYGYLEGTTDTDDMKELVDFACEGLYDTIQEAQVAGAVDIKDDLILDNDTGMGIVGNGYLVDVTKTQEFSIFVEEEVSKYVVNYDVVDYFVDNGLSGDTYFNVTGVTEDVASGLFDTYIVPYYTDTYYDRGYQTILVNDTAFDETEIILSYSTDEPPYAYAPTSIGAAATKQTSGDTIVDFSEGTVPYTVKAENELTIKNYMVTIVKKTEDAQLFVNGPAYDVEPEEADKVYREVYLLEAYNSVHDIFFANVGENDITGLNVELKDAKNIALDDYWTIKDDSTLAGFTTTSKTVNDGNYLFNEITNVGKVRLVPTDTIDGNGEIEGTLVISSDNGGTETIYLTGFAGDPSIITDNISDEVKYVPMSTFIQTNNTNDDLTLKFMFDGGTLPPGVELRETGELYGVPTQAGEFHFRVKLQVEHSDPFLDRHFNDTGAVFTLTVLDNTDQNVLNSNDYNIVPIQSVMHAYQEQEFTAEGENFDYFEDFYLDGEKLEKDTDYTVDEGSTVITIKEQTFSEVGPGKHTISSEFRDSNGVLFTASQNYEVSFSGNRIPEDEEPINSSSTDNNDETAAYNVLQPTNGTVSVEPTEPKKGDVVKITIKPDYGYELESIAVSADGKAIILTQNEDGTYSFVYDEENPLIDVKIKSILPFTDVDPSAWYYNHIKFMYEAGILVGVSEDEFAPNSKISHAVMAMAMYNMANEDTTGVEVNGDEWYSAAEEWLYRTGILNDEIGFTFVAGEEMNREQMAMILVNYCKYKGIDLQTDNFEVVTDLDDVSSWAKEGIQALYNIGFIEGKGNGVYDPNGIATRAELAALLNRFIIYSDTSY